MTVWLDNQLSPALAARIRATFAIDCVAVRDIALQRALDVEIFMAARARAAIVMTKDADFVRLLEQHGPPPQVVLVTCGNTSNARLFRLVEVAWPAILSLLERGEALVELHDQLDRPT